MTVSELSFGSEGLIGFCACCGLRRPLGSINCFHSGETVRCIDCFFGPPEQQFVFVGTAVLLRDGRTGDVVRDWHGEYFEPHGDFNNRFAVTREELYAFKSSNQSGILFMLKFMMTDYHKEQPRPTL